MMIKSLLKCLILGTALLFTQNVEAQIYQKFPTNVRYIGGGYNNVRPFFKTLEAALNDVKPLATTSNPYVFWLASDSLWVSDWDSIFTESGLTMKDSIDIYYVATGKIKWMPFGFGGSGSGASIISPDDITLHYYWPTWDQTNSALPIWQRMIGTALDSVDEEVYRLIVYTAAPLYIENDTLKIDTDGLIGTLGWDPDTTTVVRTTGTQTIAATNTLSGPNTFTNTLQFSGSGNIQLPGSNGSVGTARRLWGTSSYGSSNVYYSGTGAAGDTNAVAMVSLSTGELRNSIVGYNSLTTALKAIIDAKAEAVLPHLFIDKASYTPAVDKDVYTKIAPTFNEVEVTYLTFTGDTITVNSNSEGDYFIQITFTLTNAATDDFTLQIRKNNVVDHSCRFTGAGGTAYVTITTIHYFADLVTGDDISFYITNTANSNDPVITELNVYMKKEH